MLLRISSSGNSAPLRTTKSRIEATEKKFIDKATNLQTCECAHDIQCTYVRMYRRQHGNGSGIEAWAARPTDRGSRSQHWADAPRNAGLLLQASFLFIACGDTVYIVHVFRGFESPFSLPTRTLYNLIIILIFGFYIGFRQLLTKEIVQMKEYGRQEPVHTSEMRSFA